MDNESDKLQRDKAYPLADRLPYWEAKNLFEDYAKDKHDEYKQANSNLKPMIIRSWVKRNIKAVWSGEKRRPKAGEWYLSGSEIEAYRASNDLDMVFHIAKIVMVQIITTEVTHNVTLDNEPRR
jgi:hypothetical protein